MMKSLIKKQLAATVDVFEKVLSDEVLAEQLSEAAALTARSIQQGGKLLVAGNGGSAADAQHLVAEFVSRLTVDRPAMRAVALTTDTSILTAIGNDYGYERVFERQIEALGQQNDVFLAISTSGNSANLIHALKKAREMKLTTVGFTGNSGGRMAELCDWNVIVPSTVTMKIQECHLSLEHIFCMIVERCYFGLDFDEKFGSRAVS